jgi:hypothetical protein
VASDFFKALHLCSFTSEYFVGKTICQKADELANVSLIQAGYLGITPTQPVSAITLECLELYHQIRRRQGNFSVQSMVKVLCALHNVSKLAVVSPYSTDDILDHLFSNAVTSVRCSI